MVCPVFLYALWTVSPGPFEIDQAACRDRNRDVADIFSRISGRNIHIIDSNHMSQTSSKKLARAVIRAPDLQDGSGSWRNRRWPQ